MLSTKKFLCLLKPTVRSTHSNHLIKQQSLSHSTLPSLSSNLQIPVSQKTSAKHFLNQRQLQPSLSSMSHTQFVIPCMQYATKPSPEKMNSKENAANTEKEATPPAPTTYKEKLKQAMQQYGSTVIVFHITISLMSLGACYTAVASGLDLSAVLETLGLSEKTVNKLASNSGTFAAAYLIHKVFAPVRISITLTCTPFIVRYLRKAGFIKKALPKVEPKK